MVLHLTDIWRFRYFWLALVKMDLRSRYRRSILGIGWSIMNPILMSAVLVLGLGGILGNRDYGYYGAYLLTGLCVWDFIRGSTVAGCTALMQNEGYIRQCPMPYAIYPLRTVLGTGIHFLITLGVMLVLVGILLTYSSENRVDDPTRPARMLYAVLPTIPMMFVFCWGTATIAAFITPYFHDTKHLIEVAAQLFFFVTPIMTQKKQLDSQPLLIFFNERLNPVYTYLELVRQPLLEGEVPSLELYAKGAGLALVSAGVGAAMISWLQKKVIFEL